MSYPKGSRRLRGSLKMGEVKLLQDALEAATLERCSLSEESKREFRLYLHSWVYTR